MRGRAALVLLAFAASLAPVKAGELGDALLNGAPLIDIRFRYDTVDESDKPKDAEAGTVRARLGYRTGRYEGLNATVEFDVLQHIGAQHFNDTVDGLTQYPTIQDPDVVALNRLQLDYRTHLFADAGAPPDLGVVLGRQAIVFSDLRYIGNSTWRQHEQTYDALTLIDTSLPGLQLTYSYVGKVNRPTGPRSAKGHYDSDSHLFNGLYTGLPGVKFEGYAYLLDLEQAPTLSTATFGLTASGTIDLTQDLHANLIGTVARQKDYARNPLSIDLGNYRAEGSLTYRGLTGLAGYEILEGNGAIGFETPLGTGHLFQGWAETFTIKPPEGVTDTYVKASYAWGGLPYVSVLMPVLAFHDFSAQHVDAWYGRELDALIEAQFDSHFTFDVAYADYKGGGPFPGKREFWTYATYRY